MIGANLKKRKPDDDKDETQLKYRKLQEAAAEIARKRNERVKNLPSVEMPKSFKNMSAQAITDLTDSLVKTATSNMGKLIEIQEDYSKGVKQTLAEFMEIFKGYMSGTYEMSSEKEDSLNDQFSVIEQQAEITTSFNNAKSKEASSCSNQSNPSSASETKEKIKKFGLS